MTTPRDETPRATTVAELLRARRGDPGPGLLYEDGVMSWQRVVEESERRAALIGARASGAAHIGILLDNVPEYLLWLGAAAISGAVVVGINPTRRGGELGRDVRFTDTKLIVTDESHRHLLDEDIGVPEQNVILVDTSSYRADLESCGPSPAASFVPAREPSAADLFLLLFTSGTTGNPKAVRCTQGRLASIAGRAATGYRFRKDDVCYCPMPLFHGNAIMALWAPALAVGACMALPRKFSASGFLPDVRRFGATRFTYVGKALAYILCTPELPDDASSPLEFGFGTEASAADRANFEVRFGCRLVEGYGSSEGGASIQVTADAPPGSLGRPTDDLIVCDPETSAECPPARFDSAGLLLNAAESIGEIVNRGGHSGFEGYYKDPEADAERLRNGWYWTGDLAYRDENGFFYFAGRGGDRLRVDSENFAAGPVERILERNEEVAAAAVYAVPDPRSGDRVMAALELREGSVFDPEAFSSFLVLQEDLGTKWAPSFVRIVGSMPVTATAKITKSSLRREAWRTDDPVWWREREPSAYVQMSAADAERLEQEMARHDRLHLLGSDDRAPRSRRNRLHVL